MKQSATIGPLMEQLVQLVTDVATIKAQMAVILPAFAGAIAEASRLARPPQRYRRTPEELAADNVRAAVGVSTPVKRGRPLGKRGPYRKSEILVASTSLNGRLRHLPVKHPLRLKTEELRRDKGHIAALKYFNRHMPPNTERAERRLALAARRSKPHKKVQRADNAQRSALVAALANLTEPQKRKALIEKKQRGTRAALAWIANNTNTTTAEA